MPQPGLRDVVQSRPVRHVAKRHEHLLAIGRNLRRAEQDGVKVTAQHKGEQGREQAQSSPQVEAPQTDRPVPLPFFDQQAGDEKATQDKEEIDAQEPARQKTEVESQDGQDGQAAQPIQPRPVPQVKVGGCVRIGHSGSMAQLVWRGVDWADCGKTGIGHDFTSLAQGIAPERSRSSVVGH